MVYGPSNNIRILQQVDYSRRTIVFRQQLRSRERGERSREKPRLVKERKLDGQTIRESSREIMFTQPAAAFTRRKTEGWKIELRSQVLRTIRKVSRSFSTGEEFHRIWNSSRRQNRL